MNFLLLAAVGLDLTRQDFARVRRQGRVLTTGLLAPVILLPPIALALVGLFRPDADIVASLLLIAACPIGGISNTYSYLAQASTALSVTLTAVSCLAATVTVPVIGRAFELALDRSLGLSAPLPLLIGQLLFVLALPVALGMWMRQRAPALADRYSPALRRVAFAGTALVLMLVIADAPAAFATGFLSAAPLAATFVVASIAAGWLAAAAVTRDVKDRFTVAAEFGTRNVGVALAIAVALLGRVEFARFALTYAVCEIPLLLLYVALFRRRQALVSARHAVV
jgi:BASS family bile acid:Na+ symporter